MDEVLYDIATKSVGIRGKIYQGEVEEDEDKIF